MPLGTIPPVMAWLKSAQVETPSHRDTREEGKEVPHLRAEATADWFPAGKSPCFIGKESRNGPFSIFQTAKLQKAKPLKTKG